MRIHTLVPAAAAVLSASFAISAAAGPIQPKVVLVASSADNFTERGLAALSVPHQRLTPTEFRDFGLIDADVVIWGLDQQRQDLARRSAEVAAFLRSGGVFLGFRAPDQDQWLPSPLGSDKAYAMGGILRPEHPAFRQPHPLSLKQLESVHGGSIYRAFRDLGPGWVPLCSTGREQSWDKTPAGPAGPRYGIVELPLGRGRLILCQMIPEYAWFHDANGDRKNTGASLFENLVRYALAQATPQAASRPPRKRPESFHADLTDFLQTPGRRSGVSLASPDWRYESAGAYTRKVDRRGVLTFTHADQPSVGGSFAQISGRLPVPSGAPSMILRWYETDTFCGGREIQLGGKQHGQLALENYKRQMRYAQVKVNGTTVWEEDVCGRNPQPARRAVHYADVTELVRKAGRCEVTLRVEDRQGSGQQPFAIDVFFAAVELLTDLQFQSAASLKAEGFVADGSSLRLDPAKGILQGRHAGPDGSYALAVRLTDGFEGRSRLRVLAAGKAVADWTLSADDAATWWAVTPVTPLRSGDPLQIEIEREGAESPCVDQIAVVAARHLARPEIAIQPSRKNTPDTKQVRFTATVTEASGQERTSEVAVAGVPFPKGCLVGQAGVRVLDSGGRGLPCQFRPTGRWPDGSARTAVVAFPATVGARGKANYTIEAGSGISTGPQGGLRVVEQADQIRIDTGAIEATLSPKHGRIVNELRRGGKVMKPADSVWDLAVQTEDGRVFRSGAATVAQTRIIERGPVRALVLRTGTLANEAGRQLDYRLTLEATAGSDLLRAEVTLINREDQPELYLKRWSLDLPLAGAATGQIDGGSQWRHAGPGAVLYQHREDQITWTGTDSPVNRVAGRSSGWVRLPGVAIGPRWFWERFPQAVRFTPGGVRFDLLPEALDDGDLPTRWRDRMREVTDRYTVGGVGYPQSPGKMGLFRLARGEALSQEFGIQIDGAPATSPADGWKRLAAPLRAVADPAYTASTAAFGTFVATDPRKFARYERQVNGCYEGFLAQRRKRREYGFENFGDSTFEWGYGPSYTYWSNSEYDHHHGFALEYLRSGDPRWWELCETTSRHYRDVVVVHHATPQSEMRGGPHHHNATSLWMPQHPEQYWIADHTVAGCHVSHSWVEGLIAYAWLSGDPWAEEVVAEMADWYVKVVDRNHFGAGSQERGPGWTLIALAALAEATGDPAVLRAGNKVADWLLQWQDPIRGVISVPISEQPSYEGGSTFMHGIVGRGLGRWYDVTGRPPVKNAAIGIAEWITTEPMREPGMFWYKQSPQNSKRFGPTDQVLTALTCAYRLSGDRWFGDVASVLVSKTAPNVRSMSWYGQSLGHLGALLSDDTSSRPEGK